MLQECFTDVSFVHSAIRDYSGNNRTMSCTVYTSVNKIHQLERSVSFLKGADGFLQQMFIFCSAFTSETRRDSHCGSKCFPGRKRRTPTEPRMELTESSPGTSTAWGEGRQRQKLSYITNGFLQSIHTTHSVHHLYCKENESKRPRSLVSHFSCSKREKVTFLNSH